MAVVRDITERKRAERTIERMSYFDALTGLANRALFADHLTLAVAQAHREGAGPAVLFLDLDHFKTVNDTLGHAVGDALVQEVGRRLKTLVREGDTVARLGGDEFTVLLPRAAARTRTPGAVASKILDEMRLPFDIDGHEIHTSASMGIAQFRRGTTPPPTS